MPSNNGSNRSPYIYDRIRLINGMNTKKANIKYFLYHENNIKHPYLPQEDAYANLDNIFTVADGITHDRSPKGLYPDPSDSAKVAQIVCEEVIDGLVDLKPTLELMKRAYLRADGMVCAFNYDRPLYLNREKNAYNYGATTGATIVVEENHLFYAVVDDCFFSIYGEDGVDGVKLNHFVENSSQMYDEHFDWTKADDRKIWRKEIRNHTFKYKGKTYGYGAIDGDGNFKKFLQVGTAKLNLGDLVCLYTDGFIPLLKQVDFIKHIKSHDFSSKTYDYIMKYAQKLDVTKEKTCYFIKVS